MSQPRHDMYTTIHKGLRTRLFDTASRLQGCDFADDDSRRETLAHLNDTLAFLDEHASHEDRFVHPRLVEANPGLAQRVADTHHRVEQAGKAVRELAEAIDKANADVAVARGPELCRSFHALLGEHVAHMCEEETLVNAALWQAYSDDELRETQGALQASIAPPRFAEWMDMTLPALNLQDRVGMLMGMRAGAPPEVFDMVMEIGRRSVGDSWGEVEAALAS